MLLRRQAGAGAVGGVTPQRANEKKRAALRPFCFVCDRSGINRPAAAFSCGLASAGCFESSAGASRPRRFSSGPISGARPAKSWNSCSASLLPPRESSVSRKWSPLVARQAAVLLDPLHRVGIEHFRPDVRVVARRVTAHDVAEVRRAVTRRHRREIDAVLLQRFGFERHHVRRRRHLVRRDLVPRLVEQRRAQVLGGGEALVELARGQHLVEQFLRHRLAGLVVLGVVRQHRRPVGPHLVDLRRDTRRSRAARWCR